VCVCVSGRQMCVCVCVRVCCERGRIAEMEKVRTFTSSKPRFNEPANPMFSSFLRIRMRGSLSENLTSISNESSVDPSSTIRNSKSVNVWFSTLSIKAGRKRAPLNTLINTANCGEFSLSSTQAADTCMLDCCTVFLA